MDLRHYRLSRIFSPFILVFVSNAALAQDNSVTSDTLVQDTARFVRPVQAELSLLTYPEAIHVGIGLNFNGKKQGWYNQFALLHNRYQATWFDDGLTALTYGKKFVCGPRALFVAGSLHAGLFYAPQDDFGVLLMPDLSVGVRTPAVHFSVGGYFGLTMDVVSFFEPKWGRYSGIYSPYFKITVPLTHRPLRSRPIIPREPDSLSAVPVRPPVENQLDSTRRQLAVSAFYLPYQPGYFVYGSVEVNFPARKYGWYNSFSMHFSDKKNASGALDFQGRYSGLAAGKKYEWVHARTYFSLGVSIGGFWNYLNNTASRTNTYGLLLGPHLEYGLNLQRIVIAFGGRFSVNGGYFESNYLGSNPIVTNMNTYGIEAFVSASPYMKILLK